MRLRGRPIITFRECQCFSTGNFFFFFFFSFSLQSRSTPLFPPPILNWPWNSSTNLNESGICTLELYTKIFAEPARADRVAIKLRKVNYINYNVLLLLYYLLITVINRQRRLSSCIFHRIQTHLNRPILYIRLIVKSKTILFLKSKKPNLWNV